ncbi:MAG TPA: aminotransferase class III-fold pyridoxal phosphate-dependent enzyme, partial [Stellaceae bacterium]|nr:aminotransferase class III-fold pyridoxal phosphate-dependent enzyme [Stellaceae bacterium]
VSAAVALETLRIYEEMDLVGHVRRVGAYSLSELEKFNEHPLIGEVRGVGLLCGLECVADKAARIPYEPAGRVGKIIDRHARSRGLILRIIGDRVVFSPPLIIDEAEVDEMLRRFRGALDDTWRELRPAAA